MSIYDQMIGEGLSRAPAIQQQREAKETDPLGPLIGAIVGWFTGGPGGAVLGGLQGLQATKGQGAAGLGQAAVGGYQTGSAVKADYEKQLARTALEEQMANDPELSATAKKLMTLGIYDEAIGKGIFGKYTASLFPGAVELYYQYLNDLLRGKKPSGPTGNVPPPPAGWE